MRYIKEMVDGKCECAICGKSIEGVQNYDMKFDEFVCKDCKNEEVKK